MDDFVKFLLIAGVIIVGIFNEVKKNKAKKAENNRPVRPVRTKPAPVEVEVAPDAIPLPDMWGGPKSLDELFHPKPIQSKQPKYKQTPQPAAKQQQKKKKEEISVAASIANSSAQDKRNTKLGAQYDYQESTDDQEFAINSTEDARKAIIWGEILRRKY